MALIRPRPTKRKGGWDEEPARQAVPATDDDDVLSRMLLEMEMANMAEGLEPEDDQAGLAGWGTHQWEASKRPRVAEKLDLGASAEPAGLEAADEQAVRRSFKTQLCKFWPLGTCQKAEGCSFAHGEHELLTPAGNSLMSELGSEAKAARSWKTQICRFYVQGTCGKGLACTFAHGEHELNIDGLIDPAATAVAPVATIKPAAIKPPQAAFMALPMQAAHDYVASSGPLRSAGSKHKTVMCRFWQIGSCVKGEQCTFAHDKSELQPAPSCGGKGGYGEVAALGALPDLSSPAKGAYGSKYKTVPCKFWPLGACHKGAACTFLHEEVDGAQGGGFADNAGGWTPPGQAASGWQQASILPSLAGKVVPGFMVRQLLGTETAAMQGLPAISSFAGAATRAPSYGGFSAGGKPNNFKTQLCRYFPLGLCTRGDNCTYAHGEEDVRAFGAG